MENQKFNIEGLEKFIGYIQDSLKLIEDEYISNNDLLPFGNDRKLSLIASRLDSMCALLSITLYNLKTEQNEKERI